MRVALSHRFAWPALIALCAGCVAESSDPPLADVPTNTVPDACGPGVRPAALVDVSERNDIFHEAPFARIEGQFRASTTPRVHKLVMEAGSCRYFRLSFGLCDPGCAADEVCGSDDQCAKDPSGLDAGVMTITGLGEPIKVPNQSFSPGRYNSPRDLPDDLFDAMDSVEVSLSGADFPAIRLGARGVAQMDTALTDTGFDFEGDRDATLTWTPGPDPEACVQIVIKGQNSVHGAPLADIIECDGVDTGSMVIPGAIVGLFPLGETPEFTNGFDWPHSELTRYSRTTLETPHGLAALVVRSTTFFQISHTE